MKKLVTIICIVGVAMLLLANSNVLAVAITWNGYGVHGDAGIVESGGQITATAGDTAGDSPEYHWNKGSWANRTGEKAFYVTSDLNGQKVGAISDFSWTNVSGYWGNAYFNVMVEDSGGKKAILAPSLNALNDTGWDTDASDDVQNPYAVFEAEAGWTGTTSTGWYAANWDEVKDLTITDGPFTEFPDTLGGTATAQNDSVYTVGNWAAWADQDAGYNADWEKGGVMITFGQSTGGSPAVTVINNIQLDVVTAPVPEPATVALLGIGLVGLAGAEVRRRRKKKAVDKS